MTDRKGLLPVVDKEVGILVDRETQNPHYFLRQFKRITELNPNLASCMFHFSKKDKNPNVILYPGVVIYDLLERKSELPVVSLESIKFISGELKSTNDYIPNLIKRLKEDNLYIANFLSRYATRTYEPIVAAYSGALVYRVLEKQAELDCQGTFKLKTELSTAIKEERYEDAAKLRDKINLINKQLKVN